MKLKGKRLTEFLSDLGRHELSISDMAQKFHVSESTVKNYRKRLATCPSELAPLALTAGNGQARAKITRVIKDTIQGYQEDLQDLEEVQHHLKDWEPDTIRARIVAIKTKADIRGMADKAKVFAHNTGAGALGGAPTAQELIAQIVEHLCPTCKEQLERAFTDGAGGQ